MEIVRLLPELHQLRFEVGHAYLWADPGALTLIDTGVAGSGPAIAEAVRSLGRDPGEIRTVVLTHFHEDHTGSAAEVAGWGDVTVMAHRLEAPVVRGEVPGPPPVFTDAPDWERDLYENMVKPPPAPPCRVDRELEDGDVIDFGGGARVVLADGHTDGSVAVYLPGRRVLFTGDAVASMDGTPILGVFNLDRPRAAETFRRLAALDADTVCFGHGDPLTGGPGEASEALRAAASRLPARDRQGRGTQESQTGRQGRGTQESRTGGRGRGRLPAARSRAGVHGPRAGLHGLPHARGRADARPARPAVLLPRQGDPGSVPRRTTRRGAAAYRPGGGPSRPPYGQERPVFTDSARLRRVASGTPPIVAPPLRPLPDRATRPSCPAGPRPTRTRTPPPEPGRAGGASSAPAPRGS
ncbi:MBL fold metallo-hydrolase [Streptosporangium longisporum]